MSVKVVELEPWLDKTGVAHFFSCGERWIEERLSEGMPSAMIAGRRKFRASKVEAWLREHGYIEEDAA